MYNDQFSMYNDPLPRPRPVRKNHLHGIVPRAQAGDAEAPGADAVGVLALQREAALRVEEAQAQRLRRGEGRLQHEPVGGRVGVQAQARGIGRQCSVDVNHNLALT